MKTLDYYEKVKNFNKRSDYVYDINIGRLLLSYALDHKIKNITIVGTGLGKDAEIIKDVNNKKIIGIEPRTEFQKESYLRYQKFRGKLHKMNLGEFVNSQKRLSGIFLFVHSINHIPKKQLEAFGNSLQANSKIIIINPNPDIGKIVGKLDNTVISYLDSKRIQKILKCNIIFDFFYHQVDLKGHKMFLREAILLAK